MDERLNLVACDPRSPRLVAQEHMGLSVRFRVAVGVAEVLPRLPLRQLRVRFDAVGGKFQVGSCQQPRHYEKKSEVDETI